MNEIENGQEEVLVQDELTTLKQKADLMGLKFHPSISAEKLRAKVAQALSDEPDVGDDEDDAPVAPKAKANTVEVQVETPGQRRARLKREALKLVRIRVTCMNPAKAEWSGEIFTTGNSLIGSVKKMVPFNAEDGWHVPNILVQFIQDRQFQSFYNEKTKFGVTVRKGKLIKEFAVEILPDLTKQELKDLATKQAMAGGV